MNIIEGKITEVTPIGEYDSDYGKVYTTDLTIQTRDGAYTGEIGEKSYDTQYAIGQVIAVEMKDTSNGVKFKKHNPEYASRNTLQRSRQAAQRPSGRANAPQKDVIPEHNDKKTMVDIRSFGASYAKDLVVMSKLPITELWGYAEQFTAFIATGYLKNPPKPEDDDIPY